MTILLTGASGFVGKNLVEFFKNDEYEVLAPDIGVLDLRDQAAVANFLADNQIDTIVHCATTLRIATDYPESVCEDNLRMFFNLLRAKKTGTKLINFGSGSEYSRAFWHEKMDESFFGQHIPADSHSFSKYLISKYIEDSHDPNLLTLRIFGIYGKYEDHRYKFISNAICKNLLQMPIVINQNVCYDYLYINDFYKIVKYFIDHDVPRRAYNATPTTPIDLVSIAETINRISPYQSEIQVLNEGIGVHYSGSNRHLLNTMKGIKLSSHEEAIQDLFAYYQSNQDLIDREALQEDEFLSYAKSLKNTYFDRKDDNHA